MTEKKPSRHVEAWGKIWKKKINQHIHLGELLDDLAEMEFTEMIDSINKQGSRPLGNGCELVSCHACDRDAVCFLFPWEYPESETGYTQVCSGPFYWKDDGSALWRAAKWSVTPVGEQSTKRRMKAGSGRFKAVLELPREDCPYSFYYQDIDVDSYTGNS